MRAGSPIDHAEPFDERDQRLRLRRQWALLPADSPAPEGWTRTPLGANKALFTHPDTRHVSASGAAGALHLLGLAVSPRRPSLDLESALRECLEIESPEEAVVKLLHELAGTYALVRVQGQGEGATHFLYTDPAAMMGIYHAQGLAASTPTLLPGLVRDEALDREFPFGGANDWYPGSLTPYLGVRALIANHRLCLESGEAERFWPDRAPEPRSKSEGLAEIAELMRGTVTGLLARGPVLCSLTGGRDSRVSLAAAREHVREIGFFTLRGPSVKPCDLEYSAELARRFGLVRHVIDVPEAPGWLVDWYDELTAGMAGGARRDIVGACRLIAGRELIHLNGNLGAITKSFFWPSPNPGRLETRALAKEFATKSPRILDAVREWQSTLPELPPVVGYNLMYFEQRGGRWMGIGETGSSLFYESANVFASRQVFEAVTGVPHADQHGGTLLVDLVREMWPELLEVPYCRVTRNWGTYLPKGFKELVKQMLGRAA